MPTSQHKMQQLWPPYQLRTSFADWQIEDESGVIGTADDEFTVAETSAHQLVGCKAISWNFIDSSLSLEIQFEGGVKLRISPIADTEESIFHKEAWCLRLPDGYYRHVRWDGTMFILHKDESCNNEPA